MNEIQKLQKEIDLFNPPFLKEKKAIYKLENEISEDVYARDHFINGFEKIAEQNVIVKLEELQEKKDFLRILIGLEKIKIAPRKYNSGDRYSNY